MAEVTFDFTHDKQSRSASPAQLGTDCTPHHSGRGQPCRSHRLCTSSSCHSAATPASTLRTALSCLPCRVGNRHRCCGRCAAACRLRRQCTTRHPSLQTQPPVKKKTRWEERREGQSHHAALLGTDHSRWGQYCFHLLADQGCGRQRLATEAWLAKGRLERT